MSESVCLNDAENGDAATAAAFVVNVGTARCGPQPVRHDRNARQMGLSLLVHIRMTAIALPPTPSTVGLPWASLLPSFLRT